MDFFERILDFECFLEGLYQFLLINSLISALLDLYWFVIFCTCQIWKISQKTWKSLSQLQEITSSFLFGFHFLRFTMNVFMIY